MSLSKFTRFLKGIILKPEATDPSNATTGAMWFNSSDSEFKGHDGTTGRTFLTEDQTQDVLNKTISLSTNDVTSSSSGFAAQFNASGVLEPSSTISTTELGYLNGLTGNIETRLSSIESDYVAGPTASSMSSFAIWDGTDGQLLQDTSEASIDPDTGDITTNGYIEAVGQVRASSGLSVTGTIDTSIQASRVLITNSSQEITNSIITDTELDYLSGITSQVATTGDAQTLASKTLSSPTGDILNLTHESTPSNPSTGFIKLYAKSDNSVYTLDSDGNEAPLGGGAGQGGINLEDEPFAQKGTNSWSAFNDGNATGSDLTGGTVTGITFTAEPSETQIYNGDFVGTYKLVYSAANNQGVGISKDYSIPQRFQDRGSVYVSLDYSAESAISTGDFKLLFYDVTNSELLTSYGLEDSELIGLAANKAGSVTVRVPLNVDTASLRVGVMRAVTDSTAVTLHLSNIKIGIDSAVDVQKNSDWEDYTPTIAWTSNISSVTGKWRRKDGNTMACQVKVVMSGAADSAAFTASIPSGYTIDTSKLVSSTALEHVFGQGVALDANVPFPLQVVYNSTTTVATLAIRTDQGTSNLWNSALTMTGGDRPFTWASGDELVLYFEVPITEWANDSGLVSQTELMNRVVRARYTSDAGQAIAHNTATVINFEDKDYDTHDAVTTGSGWVFTAPETGYYRYSFGILFDNATGWEGGENAQARVRVNGSEKSRFNIEIVSSDSSAIDHAPKVQGSDTYFLEKGDTLDIQAYQSNGGSINLASGSIWNHFAIESLPDLSVYAAYSEPNKVQIKYLDPDHTGTTSPTTLSDLTFSNLTIGKWYEATVHMTSTSSANSGTRVQLTMNHDSAVIGRLFNDSSDDDVTILDTSLIRKFKATATTLTFEASLGDNNDVIFGDSGAEETWVQLEERNDLTEWSGW